MLVTPRARAALLALALASCRGPAMDPDDGGAPLALVDGARELFAAPPLPLRDGLEARLYLMGVSVDGPSIAILAQHGSDRYRSSRVELFTSTDSGASFDHHPLDADLGWDRRPAGVWASAGRVFVMVLVEEGEPSWIPMRVDLGARTYGGDSILPHPLTLTPEAAVGFAAYAREARYARFDATADAIVAERSGPLPTARACEGHLMSHDGATFAQLCATPRGTCLVEMTPERSFEITSSCVGWDEWPVPSPAFERDVLTSLGLRRFFTQGDESGALVGIAPGGAPTSVLALGEGAERGIFAEPPMLLHAGRWIRLEADGSVRVPAIPYALCADEAACRRAGDVPIVRPVGSDAYVTVEVVTTGAPPREMDHLLVRVSRDGDAAERAARREEYPFPPARGPVVRAASQLELACVHATSCFPEQTVSECVAAWRMTTRFDDARDEAYERFLAAPPRDCDAIATAYPGLAYRHDYPCNTCTANVAWRCPSGRASPYDCTRSGTTCEIDAMGLPRCGDAAVEDCGACDAAGRAVHCDDGPAVALVHDCRALGGDCGVVGGESRCAGAPSSDVCQGDVYLHHVGRAVGAEVLAREDCARAEQRCGSAGCYTPYETSLHAGAPEGCDGALLVFDLGGQRRFVDCVELGYASCDGSGMVPRCIAE